MTHQLDPLKQKVTNTHQQVKQSMPGGAPIPGKSTLPTLPGKPGDTLSTQVQRIVLKEKSGLSAALALPLVFDLNPTGVSITRSSKPHDKANVQASSADTALQLSGNLILTLKDVRFIVSPDYPKLRPRIDQLIAWSDGTVDPAAGGPLTGAKATQAPRLPLLEMSWGTSAPQDVTLSKIDVELERFSPSGEPLQAKVTLTLLCFKSSTTNGKPGAGDRKPSQVVKQGDSLPQLTNKNTGTPFDWQHLAEQNNIDDPLRLTPGSRLNIPPLGGG